MIQNVRSCVSCSMPDMAEIQENFSFDISHPDGTFSVNMKWLNERWNCWVTLPSGEVRQAGVEPNVLSWSCFSDYGFMFKTSLATIGKASVLLPTIYIFSWE